MTLAKRLLLGSAAALVATTGAHAADLPVAPAVDYVQICSIGSFTGFILPGSDVCFDIGGAVRFQMDWTDEVVYTSVLGFIDRRANVDEFNIQGEMELTFDARTMTEWGLLRGFIAVEGVGSNDGGGVTFEKAFVQVGGLVGGLTDSFFDPVYSDYVTAPYGGWGGDDDIALVGYNFSFGNGFSAGVSIEDAQSRLWNSTRFLPTVAVLGAAGAGVHEPSYTMPDFVAALRVSQAWGSAAAYGAVRNINPTGAGAGTGGDELGWAVGASASVALPLNGSTFGIFGTYADGASSFAGTGWYDFEINAAGNVATVEVYTIGAGLNLEVVPGFYVQADATYTDFDAPTNTFDTELLSLRGGVEWMPVSGLTIEAGVAYLDVDVNNACVSTTTPAIANCDDESVGASIEVTRSF